MLSYTVLGSQNITFYVKWCRCQKLNDTNFDHFNEIKKKFRTMYAFTRKRIIFSTDEISTVLLIQKVSLVLTFSIDLRSSGRPSQPSGKGSIYLPKNMQVNIMRNNRGRQPESDTIQVVART